MSSAQKRSKLNKDETAWVVSRLRSQNKFDLDKLTISADELNDWKNYYGQQIFLGKSNKDHDYLITANSIKRQFENEKKRMQDQTAQPITTGTATSTSSNKVPNKTFLIDVILILSL